MVFAASLLGLLLSFALLAAMRPRPLAPWRWTWQGIVLHAGLWLLAYSLLALALGRPWFAMAVGQALLMLLVQVNNAKYLSLREPFVFQDFEYFTDAIRHPRLYIPFLGWGKVLAIALVVIAAVGIGLWLEPVGRASFALGGQLGDTLLVGCCASVLLWVARHGPPVSFSPEDDLLSAGFLGSLWAYGRAERVVPELPKVLLDLKISDEERPHLVVVQSESFFDPRPLYWGIRPDVLAEFDRLCSESVCHGRLAVPAWGANTVRSEFAFLSGLPESALGVHRFNPYRRAVRAALVSLAHVLKLRGYRTICVHPYPASFYGRDKVFPALGFDRFIDIEAFANAPRVGPYVSDEAVRTKIEALIQEATEPTFVFVITMENHGPLHLEKPVPEDYPASYVENPPAGCDDLTVYLRHLKNADRMMGGLRDFLSQMDHPAKLCWYGDHVPIMADVYQQLGNPDGQTAYFVWSNRAKRESEAHAIALHQLAGLVLTAA